jgi:hypothetical protein
VVTQPTEIPPALATGPMATAEIRHDHTVADRGNLLDHGL